MPDANNDPLTQVAGALAALTGGRDAALLLAVSGGPDSMAMLDMVRRGWAGPVSAATVDHRLRPESAGEAAMVADYCASIAVPHVTLCPDAPITGNLQSAARTTRYRLLAQAAARAGAEFIVTAHHADDQLETMLMRLARGSGVDGLAAVRAKNGQVIRPILCLRKAELERYCADQAIPFVRDPSNASPDFDRVRMRAALGQFDVVDPLQAVRSAAALADVSDALDWMVDSEAAQVLHTGPGGASLIRHDYPAALLRRLVQRCLEAVQPGIAPRGEALGRLIDTLNAGGQGMIGDVLCRGGATWHFARAPARRGAGGEGMATE
ncbi:tRNA(Ile)-lysidine synthetase [Blastomonas sp. RAC04]|uniref:tRNA lysidine(34) synthetase TilS n=1 Tax=Blastomonas sp. RAC04 TaxID=1842535 RepID=UPI00083D4CEF|nr:tRNA lysidine(34) synthetase TilS [Blastomonas sp. RAC04]AOG00679.1 tRNA(Ile)-lysidine synthetase [Blastomonas sp. RAC04]